MPPEAIRIAEAIGVWLLLAIALPKGQLSGVRGRLTELASGTRRWLYAAPLSWNRGTGRRPRLLAELLRVIELGAPMWVIARVLEERSARRRLESKALWTEGRAAVIYEWAKGGTTEKELAARLAALACPLPAEKAVASIVATRPSLPLGWWTAEQSAAQDSRADAIAVGDELDETGGAADPIAAPLDPTLLSIRTFGRLQLLQGDLDLAERLLQKPVLAFLWLYLLVRALARPEDRLTRAELAEELTPGLAPERQRKRLRDRLSDMLHGEIPSELAVRINLRGDETVSLNLHHASADFERLINLARDRGAQKGLLSADEATFVFQVLAATEGEFLPEWDRLEDQIAGCRGAAGEVVGQLRREAESARVELMQALAANHLARREPDRAAALLERALERRPDHEGLARQLIAAYLQTGESRRATELQRIHQLSP